MDRRVPESELQNMTAEVIVREEPLKAVDGVTMTPDQVKAQGEAARQSLTTVDEDAYGTCVDERPREEPEVRFSAPGGPIVYGLVIAELTDMFGDSDETGEERLAAIKNLLKLGGGHEDCAANRLIDTIFEYIGGKTAESGRAYAQEQLGDDYDEQAFNEVVATAQAVKASGRYADWSEDHLKDIHGEDADKAIEKLIGEHEGRTMIRTRTGKKTIDRAKLRALTGGEDSFINDDDYEDRIDAVITAVPDAEWKQKVARHAREALLATLVVALPNKELHQITITAA